jgi:hypothetical protein
MNFDQKVEAGTAAIQLFFDSEPTRGNVARTIELLKTLLDKPEEFWGKYNEAIQNKVNPGDRATALNDLLHQNHNALARLAYEVYPSLLVPDCEHILAALSEALKCGKYRGQIKQQSFFKFASRLVAKEAQRFMLTERILRENRRVIYAAIRRFTRTFEQDRSVEHVDIFWEVAYLIHQRAHSLSKPGKAKLSTRLTALVKKHVEFYLTSYWFRQHRLIRERVESGLPQHVEWMSDEELASMKAEIDEPDCYAGYGFIAA